jgi:hypothetical protein
LSADAYEFRLETGDRVGGGLGSDQAPPEVRPNRRIAVAAAGKHAGAILGESSVVHETGAPEALEHVLPSGLGMSSACQPLLELATRARGRSQRSSRLG